MERKVTKVLSLKSTYRQEIVFYSRKYSNYIQNTRLFISS